MSGRHVVVGVDGSVLSTHAQDVAAEEAVRRSVPLEIVYAVPDLDVAGPVLAAAEARSRARHPALVVRLTAVAGGPASALVARGADAALTVVGTRALGGFASLASRSVARQVAAQSHGPVLVVGAGHLPQRADVGAVLAAVESDTGVEVTGLALEEAARRGARLRFLRMTRQPPQVPAESRPPVKRKGEGATAAVAADDLRLGHCRPDEEQPLLSDRELVSATADADVVVIACRRNEGAGQRHAHSMHVLLRHSHCPVLLIPAGQNEPLHL